jgi:hypothetical protein
MDKIRAKRKVSRLAKKYQKAQDNLDAFTETNAEFFETYSVLAIDRNIKLEKLRRAVKSTGIAAGPLNVAPSGRRSFDGLYLYKKFADRPDIQEALVTIEYKVDRRRFDALVQTGEIEPKTASKAITSVVPINSVLNSPPDITLG